MSRCSGSAGRPGASRRSATRSSTSSTRPRPSARSSSRRSTSMGGSSADALRERVIALRCAPPRPGPGRDRRRLGREQGPADPRGAAGGRRPDARHRRRDRRGGRRPRRGDARAARAAGTRMTRPRRRRSSGSTSARPRSRPAWSTLDGRLLALARSGYAPRCRPAATAGPSRTRARGGRRSSAPSARSAPPTSPTSWRSASTATARRSSRSTRAARRPGRRSRSSTRARRPRPTSSRPRPGVRGWALGGLPAALWVERHEPAVAAATRWYLSTWEWLAFRLTGVADRARSSRTRSCPTRPPSRRPACRVDRLPPRPATGAVVGEPDRRRGRRARAAAGIPVVGGTVDAFASYLGAGLLEPGRRLRPGRLGGRVRRLLGSARSRCPGGFVTPAPLAGRYSVGAAMAATGRALDWYRDDILGGTITTEALLRRGGRDAARRRRARLPAVPRRRAVADLGPEARGVLAGLTLAHGRGHVARAIVEASALAIRHVAAPMLAAGVDGHRDARLRRPGAERRSGTRSRPT